jgi:sulfoxide reductase heme-binding subunit YedZ
MAPASKSPICIAGSTWSRTSDVAVRTRSPVTRGQIQLVKGGVAIACLLPFAVLLLRTFGLCDLSLGANPIEELLHTLGKTGLNLLMLTLAVSPARALTGLSWLVTLRRMLGLFAFAYAATHVSVYVGLDRQPFSWTFLLDDLTERPYITLGFTALVLMIPLAATSTRAMQQRLGRRWKPLHRLVYLIATLAVIHYWWQARRDPFESLLYIAALIGLLTFRVADELRKRQPRPLSRP